MDFSEIHKSIERLAKVRGVSMIRDRSVSNSRPDRRVYRLGDEFIVKTYAPTTRDRFERERNFFELDIGSRRRPDLVEATFDEEGGGYILMTALPGRPLADTYQDLTATEYLELAADLGACIATIHAVPLTTISRLPPNNLKAERAKHFESFPDVLDQLKRARILPEEAIPDLIRAVETCRANAFASPHRLIHGDLSRWNVFVCQRDRRVSCALIDFEESAPSHVELDFVYPFISILGEAFPGRRLASSWESIWQSFVDGYGSIAKTVPDLDLIVGHAIAWHLWVSAHCLDRGHPKCRNFARIALEVLAVRRRSDSTRHVTDASG